MAPKFKEFKHTLNELSWESYRDRALHESVEETNLHAGHVMHFSGHTEHSFHGFDRAKKDRDAYASHLKAQGHKVRKHSITNQLLHGMYGNVYKVSYVPKKLKESYDVVYNESGGSGGGHKVGDKVSVKLGPHAGQSHTVVKIHPTGHVEIEPDSLSTNEYTTGTVKVHPDHVTKLHEALDNDKKKKLAEPPQGAPIYNIKYPAPKGGYRPIVKHTKLYEENGDSSMSQYVQHYNLFRKHEHLTSSDSSHRAAKEHHRGELAKLHAKMTPEERKNLPHHLRLSEETERERKSHSERMGPAPEPENYKVGDTVVPKEGPHAGRTHTVIHVHPAGHVNIKPNVPAKYNKYRQGAVKAHPSQLSRSPMKEEAPGYSYKVGDRVIPRIGPHAGQTHRVIHVHPTGHVNITPDRPVKNRYKLGAVKAHPDDLTPVMPGHLDEGLKEIRSGIRKKQDEYQMLSHKHGENHPIAKKASRELSKLLGQQEQEYMRKHEEKAAKRVVNRKTVQEAFQAAKDKKNPFVKKDSDQEDAAPQKELQDNLPGDGSDEPNKNAVPGGPAQPEKKTNVPDPENKNAKKLQIKGAGPDDKFQADPIVTPLTTMPDRGNADFKRNG